MFNWGFFVLRPAIAWALNLFILLFGVICFNKLQWEGEPNSAKKIITVEANLSGTQVESMRYIAEMLENCMSGSNGLEFYQSAIRTGTATVTGEYNKETDINAIIVYVLQKIQNQQGFPREMRNPTVSSGSEERSKTAIEIVLYSKYDDESKNDNDLSYKTQKIQFAIAKRLKSEISAIEGVSDCAGGELVTKACIYLDPDLMLRYRVPYTNVYNALSHMRNKSVGKINNAHYSMEIQLGNGLSQDSEEILSTKIRNMDGESIALKEFAQIHFSTGDDEKSIKKVNGRNVTYLKVLCKEDGNPVVISKKVKEIVNSFKGTEREFEFIAFHDIGEEIENELYGLLRAIFVAFIIVVAVVGLLLGSSRAIFITMIAMPFSLIGTFILMYLFGFTINSSTLIALVIAVGLIVDDALIIVEATMREIENGLTPVEATFKALKDLQSAVIGMTLTLSAIFLPTIIASAHDRKLLEFAVSLSVAVIISGFVSLVLTPTMCAHLLQPHSATEEAIIREPGKFNTVKFYTQQLVQYTNNILKHTENKYQQLLGGLLHVRNYVVGISMLITSSAILFTWHELPKLDPEKAQDSIYVTFLSPAGASLQYCDDRMSQLLEIIEPYTKKYADLCYSEAHAGRQSFAVLLLPSVYSRKYTKNVKEIEDELRDKASATIPGVQVVSDMQQDKTARFLEIVISGRFIDVEHMNKVANHSMSELNKLGIFAEEPRITKQFDNQQYYDIVLDQDKCAEYNISGDALSHIPAHIVYAYLTEGDQQIEARADLLPKHSNPKATWLTQIPIEDLEQPRIGELPRSTPETFMQSVYLEATHRDNARERFLLPLSHFAKIITKSQPKALYNHNGQLAVFISAKLKNNVGTADAYEIAERTIKADLDSGLTVSPDGGTRQDIQNQSTFLYLLIISLICIFLFLVILFESFIDPCIAFTTVPLATFGGFFALWMYGGYFSTLMRMGLLTLIGLIAKHGILLVEVSNAHLESGQTLYNAVLIGARQRFRPILMTTLAMVLGMSDLLFDAGVSAQSHKEMALFIIAGLLIGTALTLFVIPCAYVIVKNFVAYVKENQ